MNSESSNNLDLIKSQLGLSKLAPLEKTAKGLAADKSQGEAADKKRWKAALDFESMFLSQMYKEMRATAQSTGEGNELTEASPGREIFTEMLDNTYASQNAKNPLIAGPQGMKNAMTGISNSLAAQIYRSLRRAEGVDKVSAPADMRKVNVPRFEAANEDDTFSVTPFLAKLINQKARSGQPTAVSALSDDALKPIVDLASRTYNVSANLIKSVIKAESNNQPLAVSGAGAKGLMQLMDSTAKDLGVRNVFNANENVLAGTRYLKQMLERFNGDEAKALAAYNAGPATVERFAGIPPYQETQAYVEKILKSKRDLDASHGAGN